MMSTTSSHKPRGLAGKTLKGAGLIKGEDTNMRDLTKTGRKNTTAKKIGIRPRSIDVYKSSSRTDMQHKMVNNFDPLRSKHSQPRFGRGLSSLSV